LVLYGITLLPMTDLDVLRRHLLGYGRVLLGYSGGVDSALLAVAGRQALGPERFLAVIGRSASYP
jgi:PP-loop superfamily ATP-utilizing enzyme